MCERNELKRIYHDSVIAGKHDDQTWDEYSEEMETIESALREEGEVF